PLLLPLDEIGHERSTDDGAKKRKNDQGNKHFVLDQAVLQGEKSEYDLHRAARIHPKADGQGIATGHASQVGAHHASCNLPEERDGEHAQCECEIEALEEVGLEADGYKEDRRENVGDELV